MRFFFYGTLLDDAVFAAVVGRPLPPCVPATLAGYRRVYRAGASYPILRPAGNNSRVDGNIVDGLGITDVRRLRRFEGDEYVIRQLAVTDSRGALQESGVFLPKRGVPASDREWTLDAWRRDDRATFLKRLRVYGVASA